MIGYVAIIGLTCLTTTTVALFSSVLFRKTTIAMMTAYVAIIVLFAVPPAVNQFAVLFYSESGAALVHAEPDDSAAAFAPSAWTFDPASGQYYMSMFSPG